mmetsp:Transcript_10906/g.20128  ORF Transcript_10906/g.20128 Transcript_10906/m.20128 type:complete len:171 (+) Transcript_10906:1043-1555(+)
MESRRSTPGTSGVHRKSQSAAHVNFMKQDVPPPHRRLATLPSLDLVRTSSELSSSESSEDSSTRSVNLFDLIDEEFVVNCGAFGAAPPAVEPASPRGHHRRRKSILDMIDRIPNGSEEDSVSFMTERSYPRGVYVVPPNEKHVTVGSVGFVAADAFKWAERNNQQRRSSS